MNNARSRTSGKRFRHPVSGCNVPVPGGGLHATGAWSGAVRIPRKEGIPLVKVPKGLH
jgi:hypothetical protein